MIICKFANSIFVVVRLGASAVAVFIVANLSSIFRGLFRRHKRLTNTGMTTSVLSEIYGGLHMHFVQTFIVLRRSFARLDSNGSCKLVRSTKLHRKPFEIYIGWVCLVPFTIFLVGSLRCCFAISYPTSNWIWWSRHLYPFKTMRPEVAVMAATRVATTSTAIYTLVERHRGTCHTFEIVQRMREIESVLQLQ